MSGTGKLRQTRLAFDYRVVMAMAETSRLINVQAFANPHDLEKRRHPIREETRSRTAGYYRVHYAIMSLVGRGKYHKGFDVTFDLISKGTYPDKGSRNTISAGGIIATCVSRPIPWSPHFLDGIGTICLGSIWRGADHTLLGHVIIHVARLLNWDEAIESAYGGWNPDAAKWWRRHLESKPLVPGLDYPTLPVGLTHGMASHTSPEHADAVEIMATNTDLGDFRILAASGSMSTFKKPADDILFL